MRKLLVAIVGAAALALLGWLALDGGSGADVSLASGESGEGAARPAEPSEVEESPAADETVDPEGSGRGDVDAGVEHRPEPSAEFSGTFVLVGLDGRERRDADGSFQLLSWRGNGARADEVRVERGSWTARVSLRRLAEEIETFAVERAVAAGATAVLVRPIERIAKDGLAGLEIVARARPPSVLRVVARAGGAELAGLEIVRGDTGVTEDRHPGFDYASRVLERAATSPVDLDELERRSAAPQVLTAYTVRAPGFAWGSVQFDHRQGGERVLSLEPGSDVEFVMRGARPAPAARLRVVAAAEVPRQPLLDELLGERDSVLLEGLKPGRYLAEVGLGDWWRPGVRQAATEFELAVRRRERVALELAPIAPAAYAALSGTVWVPRAWGSERLTLSFRYLGLDRQEQEGRVDVATGLRAGTAGGQLAFDFSHPRLQVGPYSVTVGDFGVSEALELPPGGLSGWTVEIGAPIEVRIAIVDPLSGADLPRASLSWASGVGASAEPAARDAANGRFVFRATEGELSLYCSADGYEFRREPLRVSAPGPVERTVQLVRTCGVAITLYDGETRLLFPDGFDATITAVGHAGQVNSWTRGAFTRQYGVTEPGAYRIALPRISGFAAVPERDIAVDAGVLTSVDFRLQRER